MDKAPPELIARRAAKLWRNLCVSPNVDNGDRSSGALLTQGLMLMASPAASTEVLDRYEEALFKRLMTPVPPLNSDKDRADYYDWFLTCDYDPGKQVHLAMLDIGATDGRRYSFRNPIKTQIYCSDKNLHVSAGYGADNVYHYPLPDGRWLVTALQGADIDKVIQLVMCGCTAFTVEPPPAKAGFSYRPEDESDPDHFDYQPSSAVHAPSDAINADLSEALKWMIKLCENANPGAFDNGVWDQTGTINEGNLHASGIIGEARIALAKAGIDA